ncbi:MAG: helix-turn-helix domain-containing protein [Lachnospiraceae bacterium]|nr:helix-turn-helix domain-containing protein [Lachnospiraceae bacterium]
MTVGEKIKELRSKKGMTQKELGEKCGFADSAIRRYELGKANPKLETIKRIANALEVPTWELLGISKQEAVLAYENDYYNKTDYETSELSPIIKDDIIHESRFNKLKNAYNMLNDSGQKEAIKRVEELTEIKRYTEK